MLSISDNARDMLARQGAGDGFVRLTVKAGGCAGMTYGAELVKEKNDEEKIVYRKEGITVITNDESLPYLHGLTIDYSDDLISAGFRFNNQSNDSSCGCGASFSGKGLPQFIQSGANCGS